MTLIQILLGILSLLIIAKIVHKLLVTLCNSLGLGNYYTLGNFGNPFVSDSRIPVRPKVLDQKYRDSVLKKNFKHEKIATNLDAIVIGSGIGGLTAASLLSKAGKKVLVLEQHDQAGGCCHTFIEKGYEFDTGIHYIGEMNSQTLAKTLIDQISNGQIQWADLDEIFDTVVFKTNEGVEQFFIYGNLEKQKRYLKSEFPEEADAIDKYYKIVNEIHEVFQQSAYVKFIPLSLIWIIDYFGIIRLFTNFYEWNKKSATQVVSELTNNETLRAIFSYCYGNYATNPNDAGFVMQAFVTSHYMEGASYPVGGPTEIPFNIIPLIQESGGDVLVNAKVSNILINSQGRAYGVKLRHGSKDYEIFAPVIISNAGIYNTMKRFLPQEIAEKSRLYPFIQKTKHAGSAMNIFVGLDATAEELEVSNKNYWIFSRKDVGQAFSDTFDHPKEDYENVDLCVQFLSFPSAKDPLWNKKFPGKTTMVIVSPINFEWFSEWQNNPVLRRGDDYEAMKNAIGYKIIDHACDLFPKLKNHIDCVNIGTPLSNNHYLGVMKGEILGLSHTKNRFSISNNALLRPKTDIQGLFLTGQDVCSGGFIGGLFGGLFCAQQVLNRHIMGDLENLHKTLTTKKNN